MTFSPQPVPPGTPKGSGEAEVPRRVFSAPAATAVVDAPRPPGGEAPPAVEAPRPLPVQRPATGAPTAGAGAPGSGPAAPGSGPAAAGPGPRDAGPGPAAAGSGPAAAGPGPVAAGPGPVAAGSGKPADGAAPQARPGPPVPGERVDWAMVPRVNLLPQEIIDARRFKQLQRVLAGLIVLVLALCGLLTAWAQNRADGAEEALAVTRLQTLDLQRQQSRYAEVPKVSGELDAARTAREQALGGDVLWYRFLTDLAVNTPDGSVLQSVTIVMSGGTKAAAATEPLTPAGLGTVTVSGEAGRYTDVSAWLDAAGRVNGLAGAQLQSATRAAGGASEGAAVGKISFSGTAVVTAAALSRRYDRRAG